MRADRGTIGWGLGHIALDGGWLLREIGSWPESLRVWPLALIAAGVGMLVTARRRVDNVVPLALGLGSTVEVEIHGVSHRWERAIGWAPNNWTLSLHPDVATTLAPHTGATKTRADLRDLRVTECVVKTGASDTEIIAPASGASRLSVEAGVASVTVRIPDGVAAEIRNRSALGSVEIDEFRFPRSGDVHRSEGFGSAADRVAIELDGGLTSFTVR